MATATFLCLLLVLPKVIPIDSRRSPSPKISRDPPEMPTDFQRFLEIPKEREEKKQEKPRNPNNLRFRSPPFCLKFLYIWCMRRQILSHILNMFVSHRGCCTAPYSGDDAKFLVQSREHVAKVKAGPGRCPHQTRRVVCMVLFSSTTYRIPVLHMCFVFSVFSNAYIYIYTYIYI